MKVSIFALMVCACLMACNKQKEATLTKTITFNVFASATNPPPATDTTWVTVYLQTAVTNDSGHTFSRQWDTTLERRRLRLYADSTRPLQVVKSVDQVLVNHQVVGYTVKIVWEGGGRGYFNFYNGYLNNPGDEHVTLPVKLQE